MTMMALQLFQPPLPASFPSSISSLSSVQSNYVQLPSLLRRRSSSSNSSSNSSSSSSSIAGLVFVGKEDTQLRVPDQDDDDDDYDPSPEDLECISQIKRVLELLRKNRDMIFSEVKLTVMIEDPREVERRRLLGIDDSEAPTREDLATVLEQVHEGKVPKDHVALRMLAEEMIQWPNLEVEIPKKKRGKSLYAKATDTGVDPQVSAKRLNVDWDSAANIEDADVTDETEVPAAVGYGALYLVTAFPVIIGISVVLILFYNSLQ